MAKSIGGKAAKIALAAAGAAALSAVGAGVLQFRKWAKDPGYTKLWFGFPKKGILITKTDEPGHFKVQTGYRWQNDETEEADGAAEPEMEITLPEDALDSLQDVTQEAAETGSEIMEKAAETVEAAVEAAADALASPERETETPEAGDEA